MNTSSIDLRSQFPSARDQGRRPTCLAFAISDAHMVAAQRPKLLAPEYIHYHAARRAGVSLDAGVGLRSMRDALLRDGQPSEDECPYASSREDSWSPPPKFSAIWTRASTLLIGKASEILTQAVLANRAHVLVLRISRSFHAPNPGSHVVLDDGGKDHRLHAVVIIGVAHVAGTTSFLARNSWGTAWGQDGHAWLPGSYIDARALNIVELEGAQ